MKTERLPHFDDVTREITEEMGSALLEDGFDVEDGTDPVGSVIIHDEESDRRFEVRLVEILG